MRTCGPPLAATRHRQRPRMLRIWGALSTPLLIGTVVVLLLGPPLAFLWSIVLFVVLFLGVEAAARGRLLSFLVGLALTALTVAVAAVVVTALFQNWRVVLACLLGLVAAGPARERPRAAPLTLGHESGSAEPAVDRGPATGADRGPDGLGR